MIMRYVILATILLLAACGGGGGGEGNTTRYTSEQLESALITLDDLPNGWSTFDVDNDGDSDNPCGAADLFNKDETADHRAEGSYSQSIMGPYLFHALVSLTEGDAADVMDRVAEDWDCGEYTDPDGDTFKIQKVNFDRLGDETLAFRLQSVDDDDGFPVQADYVVTRKAGVISAMIYAGVIAVQFDDVEKFAKLAGERLKRFE